MMKRQTIFGFVACILILQTVFVAADDDEDESETSYEFVTCGSIIKLGHVAVDCRLHSHEVSYGTGDGSSGQQSVTCYPGNEDPNSLWIVKAPTGQVCPKGKIVKKGDVIRLQHARTRLNLHAHNHKSPLTRQVEVSCYGPNGFGDEGDHWVVETSGSDSWARTEPVRLKSKVMNAYLSSRANAKYGHPIAGQYEVAGTKDATRETYWLAQEGFYFASEDS